jgi:2-iminobutanoate/2-iminopropanoate deaminase
MDYYMKQIIATSAAPAAIGAYSQAVRVGNLLFTSGQLPVDPTTGAFASETFAGQAEQSLKNIGAILAEAGCTFADVVKTTVFLADMSDFATLNEVYGRFFTEPYPARSAVAVKQLPKGALIEVEVIAEVK